jgi:isocitrate dehydrogenase (NAD+)
MAHVITLIPGDGIGPEVTEAVVRIFKAAGVDVDWDRHDAGVIAFERFGQSLPAELLESIKRNKVALKGPVTTPIAEGFTSVNVGLRKALNLFANLRPVRNLPASRRASTTWTWSSSARTPRTSTPGSSTRSSPAWSRA